MTARMNAAAPLAEHLHSTSLEEFMGQPHLTGLDSLLLRLLDSGSTGSIIFWGLSIITVSGSIGCENVPWHPPDMAVLVMDGENRNLRQSMATPTSAFLSHSIDLPLLDRPNHGFEQPNRYHFGVTEPNDTSSPINISSNLTMPDLTTFPQPSMDGVSCSNSLPPCSSHHMFGDIHATGHDNPISMDIDMDSTEPDPGDPVDQVLAHLEERLSEKHSSAVEHSRLVFELPPDSFSIPLALQRLQTDEVEINQGQFALTYHDLEISALIVHEEWLLSIYL
ncbi:uncharacterized protein LAESUDRAFT_718537 [Laetiporus sulphureus 93-53]|uniref:Uncharacterized protein n=1 Tax=Laetiporus sulphureus 93-53 TaxID=1314785 RepID=A0A165AUR2_9APHY|nr:uncharacterized protein LAESUDRAFT_718537 [Laetiporus sulphureus 93-53]KZS99699.1 hypothetical protein LAESUDRAFT_718537 [Laetiporus sulphureus 93-53]